MDSDSLRHTLNHLSEAAKIVNGDSRTKKLLHSYYLSRVQRIATVGNTSIAKPSNRTCEKCFTTIDNNSTLSIKPRRIHRKKYKNLVTAFESKQNLSNSKEYLAKKYQKLVYNIAETTCSLCKAKQKTNIRFIGKNTEKLKPEPSFDPPIVQLSELELVQPKKRKRDKYAGLIIKDKTSTNSSSNLSTKPIIQPIKVIQMKSKKNDVKKSKSSSGVKKMKNVATAEKQRKSILLLANVLKMNDQKQQNSSQVNLHKMFKK